MGGSPTVEGPRRRFPAVDPFTGLAVGCSVLILGFILLPLVEMVRQPSGADLALALGDPDVRRAIGLSILGATGAAVMVFVGLPFFINTVILAFSPCDVHVV